MVNNISRKPSLHIYNDRLHITFKSQTQFESLVVGNQLSQYERDRFIQIMKHLGDVKYSHNTYKVLFISSDLSMTIEKLQNYYKYNKDVVLRRSYGRRPQVIRFSVTMLCDVIKQLYDNEEQLNTSHISKNYLNFYVNKRTFLLLSAICHPDFIKKSLNIAYNTSEHILDFYNNRDIIVILRYEVPIIQYLTSTFLAEIVRYFELSTGERVYFCDKSRIILREFYKYKDNTNYSANIEANFYNDKVKYAVNKQLIAAHNFSVTDIGYRVTIPLNKQEFAEHSKKYRTELLKRVYKRKLPDYNIDNYRKTGTIKGSSLDKSAVYRLVNCIKELLLNDIIVED